MWCADEANEGRKPGVLRTSDLEYDLPESLIATSPAEPRDSARLLVVSRSDPSRLEHRVVRDLPALLAPGDLMVLNTTRVIPARLIGHRADTGGRVEGLYLDEADAYLGHDKFEKSDRAHTSELPTPIAGERRWAVLLQGKRMKAGIDVAIELDAPGNAGPGPDSGVRLHLLSPLGAEDRGGWIVSVRSASSAFLDAESSAAILERIGRTPLPPYILKAREREAASNNARDLGDAYDRARYQTVYATAPTRAHDGGADPQGLIASHTLGASVAAPTAGLHMTPAVLDALAACGVGRADVVLHVGSGTFRPVETEFVEQHRMHTERCAMPGDTRAAIHRTRRSVGALGNTTARAGRVICVGTTSARTVESFARLAAADVASSHTTPTPDWLATDILITPGYPWRWTDGLLTNFHLPRSTLLAMVASLFPGGVERLMEIYGVALRERYRFYSYGDAMLVLP